MMQQSQTSVAVEHRAAAMKRTDAPSRFAIFGHPVHPMLIPFPIAFLVGALVADIVFFAAGGGAQWANFSRWLLLGGWVSGILTALAGLIELLSVRKATRLLSAYVHAATALVAVALAIVNWYTREGGDEAVVTTLGIVLSAITVAVLLVVGWFGGSLTYRHRIGVTPAPDEKVH